MMLKKGLKKYLINPSLGLVPVLMYILLYSITHNVAIGLIIGLVVSVISEVLIRWYTKTSRCGIMFIISFVALSLTFLIWILLHNCIVDDVIYIIIIEGLLVLCFIFINLSKIFLNKYFFQRNANVLQKTFINQLYELITIAKYILVSHIFLLLIYVLLNPLETADNSLLRYILFVIVPIGIILGIVLYETIKIKIVVTKLRREEWLPIVNGKGEVTGKIAKSVSVNFKNKFLHPVVRVAFICNNQIYLQKRSGNDQLAAGALDHPFEKYILFDHEITEAVENCVKPVNPTLPFKFLLKYVFENDETNRLVYLFVSRIDNEDQINKSSSLNGKFWTLKQINEDFGVNSKFSECFQLEYEYLKNTIFVADRYLD